MTKVSPGLPILDFNGSRCPNQTLGCTIPYPWALIEIYWTWPINEPRHVLRNNQFGSLMNVWNFSWINVTSKDQRFNLETIKSQGHDTITPGYRTRSPHAAPDTQMRDSLTNQKPGWQLTTNQSAAHLSTHWRTLRRNQDEDTNWPRSIKTCFTAHHKKLLQKINRTSNNYINFIGEIVKRNWPNSFSNTLIHILTRPPPAVIILLLTGAKTILRWSLPPLALKYLDQPSAEPKILSQVFPNPCDENMIK